MKLSPPGGNDRGVSYSLPGAVQFTVRNASFSFLMGMAFDARNYQLAGLPKWADTTLYDISAKVEGDKGLSYEQTLPLLQSLLAERLHLKVHHETKMMKGYALVVAKDGPKLQASKAADKGAARPAYIMQDGIRALQCHSQYAERDTRTSGGTSNCGQDRDCRRVRNQSALCP